MRKMKPVVLEVTEAISPRLRRNITIEPYVKRERLPNEATGWAVSKMVGTYVPEPMYYRNNGNKHIPSRGMK